MKELDNKVFHEKYIKHLAWLDGYASTWDGWQMSFKGYNVSYSFFNKNLKESEFSFANIDSASYASCIMDFAGFNSSVINKSTFNNCSVRNSVFYCTEIKDTAMTYSDLTGTDFRFSDFTNVSFKYNVLRGCDFSYVNFNEKCDIKFNDITDANFAGTKFDFSNIDGLVPFCYAISNDGKTVIISHEDKQIYAMPENLSYLSVEKLNKALRISDNQQKNMYNEYLTGFTGKTYVQTMYKARFRILKDNEEIYAYDTDTYSNKHEFDKYIAELLNNERKRNPKMQISVFMQKKSASDIEYVTYNEINTTGRKNLITQK